MLSKEVLELSKQHSVIRDIFEFGMQRAKEVGPENVFDFSIGNPSVPAPKEVDGRKKSMRRRSGICRP